MVIASGISVLPGLLSHSVSRDPDLPLSGCTVSERLAPIEDYVRSDGEKTDCH